MTQLNPMAGKGAVLALAAILMLGLALRLQMFNGYVGLDDHAYAEVAAEIVKGDFDFTAYTDAPVFPQRLGIILPCALLIAILGPTEWAVVLSPLVVSMLGVLLAYVAGSHFFGARAGLFAALFCTAAPVELMNATVLMPDLPGAVYAGTGLVTVLLAWDSAEDRAGRLLALGLVAGVFIGYSWLCKESLAYFAPLCGVLLLIMAINNPWRAIALWGGVAAGSVGILVAEMAFYEWATGDHLFRFHQIEKNYALFKRGFFTEGSKFGWKPGEDYLSSLIHRLFVSGPKALFLNKQYLYTGLAGLAAGVYGLMTRDRRFLIPSVWLIVIALTFNFASSSTEAYLPLAIDRQNRYLYPILLPAVVLTAGLIDRLLFSTDLGSLVSLLCKGVAAVFILISAHKTFLAVKYHYQYFQYMWTPYAMEAAKIVKPTDRVYTDVLSIRALKFYWGFPSAVGAVNFEGHSSGEVQPGSFVFLNKKAIQWLDANVGMIAGMGIPYVKPPYLTETPAAWTTVWEKDAAALLRVE